MSKSKLLLWLLFIVHSSNQFYQKRGFDLVSFCGEYNIIHLKFIDLM